MRSAHLVLRIADADAEATWKVTWEIADVPAGCSYQSANLHLQPVDAAAINTAAITAAVQSNESAPAPPPPNVHLSLFPDENAPGSAPAELAHHLGSLARSFLLNTLASAAAAPCAAKLVGPRGHGRIIRSDIIPKRMHDAEHVASTVPLAHPLQLFTAEVWTATTPLSSLLRTSAAAIHLSPRAAAVDLRHHVWPALDVELEKRLNLPLVLPAHLVARHCLALVEGGLAFPFGGACSRQLYDAAKSLGIDLVVLAAPGHDLQRRPEFAHWCHRFIPIPAPASASDPEFPARIVAAVRQYEAESGTKVDGVLTTYESYHVAVSTAAQQLGLPAEPVSAYEVATDKFKTSLFEGRKSFSASSVHEALHIASTEHHVPWPLILKPCRGWASDLVFKVDNIEQLQQAAPRMKSDSHGHAFVMEHYCSGPEVDINFALYDGRVLFWDIGDETPKNADNGAHSFGELDYLFPSLLPIAEQQAVYNAVLASMTRLGFRNGIYHCEARIENSSVEWRLESSSGVPVLRPRPEHNGRPAESWLIEINTRPPGGDTCDFIEATWGVDYWALLLVTKLRDASAWADALSQPYRDGAQYHADKIWIIATYDPETQKGIWASGNVTEELLQRRPDLARHVCQHRTFAKNGDQLKHPSTGSNSFVAYLHVFSRLSRAHLMDIATEIRRELRIEIS